MRRDSRAARSALSRLADAREGLREQAVDVLASDAREGLKESRRDSRVAYSALARLPDAREGLKKAAANRVLPAPRFRISRTRARG